MKNVPFKLDEYIFDKELQHTNDFICVALYFFSAGWFVIKIHVKKMKEKTKTPYVTKPGEVYWRDSETHKLTSGNVQDWFNQVRNLYMFIKVFVSN